MSEPEFEVVWPLGRQVLPAIAPGAKESKPFRFDGARIGFLWNYTRKGDEMFRIIKDNLSAMYKDVSFVDYDTFGDIHGASEYTVVESIPRLLAENKVDLTIVGIGG